MATSSKEAIIQEFYNNEDHQNLLLYHAQPTGTLLTSGCSTYGRIEKVKVGHYIQAGKVLHERVLSKLSQLNKALVTDYVLECKRIASIDHKNINKMLGTVMIPNSSPFPVLVMEMMEHSLHQYLENTKNIPVVLKQSILEDIARGLLYLHTQSPRAIIHQDLTAHNVLLSPYLVAKITDVGNACLTNPKKRVSELLKQPKVMVYMPPECFNEATQHSPMTSWDVFSFGHVTIFCAIQMFPDNLLSSDYTHSEDHDRECVIILSEVNRRREYFTLMDLKLPRGNKHPLVNLAEDCLNNDPHQRPKMEEVLDRLSKMLDEDGRLPNVGDSLDRMEVINLLFQQDSLHTLMSKEKEEYHIKIQAQSKEIRELNDNIRSLKDQLKNGMEEKERLMAEKDIQMKEAERQLEQLQAEKTMGVFKFQETLSQINTKLETRNQLRAEVKERKKKLQEEEEEIQLKMDVEIKQLISDSQFTIDPRMISSPKKTLLLSLEWQQLPDLPIPFPKHPSAVLLQKHVYLGGGASKNDSSTVFRYDLDNSPDGTTAWEKLPAPCPRREFGMTTINDTLVIVGGVDPSTKKPSNKVTVWDETAKKWKDGFYPSLNTARASPLVLVHNKKWLIVVGGVGLDNRPLTSVEKFDVDSQKPCWTLCSPLPEKCFDMSYTVVDKTLYIAGSVQGSVEPAKVIFSALFPLLIRIKPKDETVWERLPDIPNSAATILSVTRREIFSFGGGVDMTSCLALVSPIFRYTLRATMTETGNNWERVGSLPCERSHCTCLSVSEYKVLLLGGTQVQSPEGMRRVDVGTFLTQKKTNQE